MIYFNKLNPDEIKKQLPLLKNIFIKFSNKISAAYLFGSFHRKNITPLSDVDIAILFKNNLKEEEMNIIELQLYKELSQTLKTDEIDLINLNIAPLSMQYGVLRNKELLYYNDKDHIVDFQNKVILEYMDFKPYREELNRVFLDTISGVKKNG